MFVAASIDMWAKMSEAVVGSGMVFEVGGYVIINVVSCGKAVRFCGEIE